MDIINIFTLQLSQIQSNLKKDLDNNYLTYNYFVHGSENFLNFLQFQSYILNNECKNIEPIKNINRLSVNIVELWNVDFINIPDKLCDDKDENLDFYAVSSSKENKYWQTFNTSFGKEKLLKNYNYDIFSIHKIANICMSLGIFIENQFPEAIIDYSVKYYLNHYLKTGRFHLQSVLKPLESIHFDSFCIRIENYEFRYYYILKNLKGKKQTEFKYDTIDHLKKIRDAQLLSKYKVLINEVLLRLESNNKEDKKAKKTTATTFKEIFIVNDYEKYINALHQVENPVIDENWNFTGKQKGSKGVVCNWIKDLQTKGIISGKYNRQILAEVCNNEIKDFDIGKDGKTFDNFSPKYNDNYKDVLLEIIAKLPLANQGNSR